MDEEQLHEKSTSAETLYSLFGKYGPFASNVHLLCNNDQIRYDAKDFEKRSNAEYSTRVRKQMMRSDEETDSMKNFRRTAMVLTLCLILLITISCASSKPSEPKRAEYLSSTLIEAMYSLDTSTLTATHPVDLLPPEALELTRLGSIPLFDEELKSFTAEVNTAFIQTAFDCAQSLEEVVRSMHWSESLDAPNSGLFYLQPEIPSVVLPILHKNLEKPLHRWAELIEWHRLYQESTKLLGVAAHPAIDSPIEAHLADLFLDRYTTALGSEEERLRRGDY